MSRRADWEFRLHAYADEKNGKPFRWGRTDCGSLVRGAIKVTHTGKPLAVFTPYRSGDAAQANLDAIGGITAGLEASGATRVRPTFTQPGDIVVLPGHDGHGLPRTGIALNGGKVLTSLPGHGVYIGALHMADAEVWRLPS